MRWSRSKSLGKLTAMKVTYARLSNHLRSLVLVKLGNPKAAAHVAVRPSVLVTVKC